MKIVFDIENDVLFGLMTLISTDKEDAEKVKEYAKTNDSVDIDLDMMGKDDAAQMRIAMAALAVAAITTKD